MIFGRVSIFAALLGSAAFYACTNSTDLTPAMLDAGSLQVDSGVVDSNTASTSLHLYVPTQSGPAIYVYDIGPGASAEPVRKIVGPSTKLENPQSVVVDNNGALYVANYERDVTVYAPGANGDAAPTFTFAVGAHPQSVTNPSMPTVIGWTKTNDRSDSEIFIFQDPYQTQPGLLVGSFPQPNAQGGFQWSPADNWGCAANSNGLDRCRRTPKNGPPVACPSPDINACLSDQGSGGTFELYGRGVGSRSNSLIFRRDGAIVISFGQPNTVATYGIVDASTGTTLTPLQAIVGAKTGLDQPRASAFDAEGNLYVANTGLISYGGTVTVYAPDADGDVAPIRTLVGLDHPFSLALGK